MKQVSRIESAQHALAAIDCDSLPEDVALAIQAVEAIKDAAKELNKMMNESLEGWLADGRSLEIGAKRYYLGNTITKKAVNNSAVIEALFAAAGGDLEEVAGCISSSASAWKFAKAKQIMGDDKYKKCFIETVKTNVRGDVIKSVKAIDTRFQK